ncbi:MAG: ribonuclease [Candidatus Sericytochromatia bacterium]|nr:MAG: ribonuclease [Candidatus Sericytochromatia bacterium]
MPINKIINKTNIVLDISKNRPELVQELATISNNFDKSSNNISLSDLWEILKDEEKSFTLEEICELYFGQNYSDVDKAGMIRSLIEDSIYFDFKTDITFIPKSQKIVEQILLQKKIEEEKEKQREIFSKWFYSVIKNENNVDKPDNIDKFIEIFKDIAILGNKSEKYSEGLNIISNLNINAPLEDIVLDFLIKIKYFDEDENIKLHEFNIPTEFSNKVLSDININLISNIDNREDLRHLEIITIDDETTKDIDDGISLLETDNGYQLGIHIADPSHFVLQNTFLDKEAKNRASSIYLPDRVIEMLPKQLSEDICSLVENQERLALSILVNLSKNFDILDFSIVESLIKVSKRLTYEQADLMLENNHNKLKILFQIANKLIQNRISKGALIFNKQELKIKVDSNKKIHISKYKDYNSNIIVSEIMILANNLVAEFCLKNKIPCIYRYQDEPSQIIEFSADIDPILLSYKQRKLIKKSEVSTISKFHYGLGLDSYTQITSPIRRYMDLVIHRQIKEFLKNKKILYTEDDLKEIITYVDYILSNINIVQKYSNKYWLCKYLKDFIGYRTPAIVLDESESKYLVYLTEFFTEVYLFKEIRYKYDIGSKIEVVIKDTEPFKGGLYIDNFKADRDSLSQLLLIDY